MKKILCVTLLTLFAMFSSCEIAQCEISKKINANIKTKRVPAGTLISMKALDAASSNTSSIGDGFDMMITDNVKVDNETVIPAGSVVRGTLEEVESPKMLYKGGMIRFNFDHVVSSTGKQVSFKAGLCNNPNITYDGALSSKTNYGTAISETAETTKKIVVNPTNWAWEKGDNVLNGKAKYIFAPVTAVVTAPFAGIYFIGDSVADLFKKGKNINIECGDIIQVQLLEPVDMPVY